MVVVRQKRAFVRADANQWRVIEQDLRASGPLPSPWQGGTYPLPDAYVTKAIDDVAQQLSQAGVRLAFILNTAPGKR